MSPRVLLTAAGTGATNNLVRSLRAARPALSIVGCNDDRFVLKNSAADRNWLTPAPSSRDYSAALGHIVATEQIDVVMPNSDADVQTVARLRHRLACRTFLPSNAVVSLCRDKYRLATYLQRREVAVARTYPVANLRQLSGIFARLAPHRTLWCRIRTGAGSMGATPVRTPTQARYWIAYWREMRGVPASAFTLSEYLPGRDFACQSLWKDGRLVLVKTVERLSYFGGWSRPSGVSSIAALAKTVDEPRVADMAIRAVRALDPRVSGAFSVDLKENGQRVPCVTEINAGRFITMLSLFDFSGKRHMSETYLRLALGEPVDMSDEYDVTGNHYFIRDVDTFPGIFDVDELFEGIADGRYPRQRPRPDRRTTPWAHSRQVHAISCTSSSPA